MHWISGIWWIPTLLAIFYWNTFHNFKYFFAQLHLTSMEERHICESDKTIPQVLQNIVVPSKESPKQLLTLLNMVDKHIYRTSSNQNVQFILFSGRRCFYQLCHIRWLILCHSTAPENCQLLNGSYVFPPLQLLESYVALNST